METERETEEIEKLSKGQKPKRNPDKGNEGKERCYIGKVGAPVGGVSDLLHPFPCLLIQWRHQAISSGHAARIAISVGIVTLGMLSALASFLYRRDCGAGSNQLRQRGKRRR
jgi:hypothetical protein